SQAQPILPSDSEEDSFASAEGELSAKQSRRISTTPTPHNEEEPVRPRGFTTLLSNKPSAVPDPLPRPLSQPPWINEDEARPGDSPAIGCQAVLSDDDSFDSLPTSEQGTEPTRLFRRKDLKFRRASVAIDSPSRRPSSSAKGHVSLKEVSSQSDLDQTPTPKENAVSFSKRNHSLRSVADREFR
ncbi:unnamed protein product, partial [Cyprideis torosa]